MSHERTKYADSILTTKGPYEASETVRIRLSQAKLINKDFYQFFKEIADLRKSYIQQLRKIVAENEDLNKLLKTQMLDTKVLTAQEMADFGFNSLGELEAVWQAIINELKTDLKASTEFHNNLEKEVIAGLERANENDPRWSQSKKMHAKLSQLAANIDHLSKSSDRDPKLGDLNRQWDSEAPYLFDIFETVDHDRLGTLKKCALRYQTGYGDYILSTSKQSEDTMSKLLEFDPEAEVDRFARDASSYSFQSSPVALDGSSPSPSPGSGTREKRRSMFGGVSNLGHRFTSQSTNSTNSTVLHHDLMNDEFSDPQNNKSLSQPKKSQSKLRSKVGSIFGKGKLRSKRFSENNTPPEKSNIIHESDDDASSIRRSETVDSATTQQRRETLQNLQENGDARAAETNNNRASYFGGGPPSSANSTNYYQPSNSAASASYPEPTPATTAASNLNPGSLSSDPVIRASSMSPINMTQVPVRPLDKQLPLQQSADVTENNNGGPGAAPLHHIRAPAMAPSLPPSRNKSINSYNRNPNGFNLQNRNSMGAFGTSGANAPGMSGSTPGFRSNASPDMISSAAGTRESANNLLKSQVTGDLTVLNPQSTGSSASLKGQNVFQHSTFENTSAYGLNASIAEVISCTFREGILEESQLIGELALNYVSNSAMRVPLPIEINLKIDRANTFSKVILNQAFIQRTEAEFFKVNPLFIDGRTLGAVKYSMKNPSAPVTIHPVWRFEPHQASVVLTIKMSPSVPAEVTRLVLEEVNVFVSVSGAETSSALSKPQGSFSKEKKRIAWRFKEPLILQRNGEERLIARFMTDRMARESDNGVSIKFIVRGQGPRDGDVGSGISLRSQELDENNPFGGPWNLVHCTRTLAAGSYYGLAQ
ncbi:SYP1 (YCR030C) [Zygosaccharomyces parabailii]|nr:SYP1 (YCR030C) [Zygosaccharomyces parabailii]CDH09119.1 related to Suppressor of yeast profilin deletion [Zygosaccharomyces bailii ISA1307]